MLLQKLRSRDFQSLDSHVPTENRLRHLKNTRDQAYCVLFRKKRGTYVGSTVVPTYVWVYPENSDKTDEVSADISERLKFGI